MWHASKSHDEIAHVHTMHYVLCFMYFAYQINICNNLSNNLVLLHNLKEAFKSSCSLLMKTDDMFKILDNIIGAKEIRIMVH